MEKPYADFLVKFYEKHGLLPHKNTPENKRAAVLIEGTCRWFLPHVLSLYKFFLGNEWNFYIFHTKYNIEYMHSLGWDCQFFMIDSPTITVDVYNSIYKAPNFWDIFKEDWILSFELDTILCQPYDKKWERWNMIGAPCGENGEVMNGGLCLRNKEKSKQALKYFKFFPPQENEDISFTKAFQIMDIQMPDGYEAALFSVENFYYSLPFGVHGTTKNYIPTITQQKIVDQIQY